MKRKKYVNRDISWLSFNARVLQEAMDPSVPMLERLKFLGIYSSNLDEFFSVRFSTLKRMISSNIDSSVLFGEKPERVLAEILDKVKELRDRFDETFSEIKELLKKRGIHFIDETQLSEKQQQFVKEYFDSRVRPRLIPMMLDNIKNFPYLKNCVIYLFIVMSRDNDAKNCKHALIEVPVDVLPRFINLPSIDKQQYVIMLDDIIRFGLSEIFKIFDYTKFEAYTIKVTRDAEIDIDDDIRTSMYEKIAKSIKTRKTGDIVRFIYDRKIPENFLNFILQQNKLTEIQSIIPGHRYHNARDMISFGKSGDYARDLFYVNPAPIYHPLFKKYNSIFQCIRENDILLHYPYHSFHSFIDLLREAAIDPKVRSIKMTIYRLANQSNVINALMNAVSNGKNVTVVMELQARFDEENNIKWARKLEESGVNLISSIPGMKVHSKLCLITRREKGTKENYVAISTGNFNEATARLYTDHVIFTYNQEIAKEAKRVFDMFTYNFRNFRFVHLLISPFYLRKKIGDMINHEIRLAKAGKKAAINIKVNNFMDKPMTDRIYRASQAGVKIRLIVRSNCSVIPGIKNLSENIEIHGIVDKYLEHSRIFWFHNSGEDNVYISSADIMVRNLDRRVEVAVPVYDQKIKQELMDYFEIQFQDNTKSRYINHEIENTYIDSPESPTARAQVDIYRYLENKKY
ncbi:MAG: polyphosphate kinase 1 [Candidatus Marinimicrobia bacterium]|nr:polyphosphate kinase 1 [Candidatus Neomarinimicrobiota bacterium]